jgi:hypothetical protein
MDRYLSSRSRQAARNATAPAAGRMENAAGNGAAAAVAETPSPKMEMLITNGGLAVSQHRIHPCPPSSPSSPKWGHLTSAGGVRGEAVVLLLAADRAKFGV